MTRLTEQLCAALRAHLDGGRLRLPEAGAALWSAFCDLQRGRTWHENGPNPITWSDMAAWAQLTRRSLQPHHVETLRRMDEAFIDHVCRKRETPKSEITPAAFDALFG